MSNVFVQVGVGFPLLLAFLLWVGRVRKAVVDPLEAQAQEEWKRELLDRERQWILAMDACPGEDPRRRFKERAALDEEWADWYAIDRKEG